MKTLRDFLLAEAKEDKDKDKEKSKKTKSGPPHNLFKDISNVGSISNAAKEFIGGKIKDSKAAASTDEGKKKIRDNLGAGDGPGGDDPYKILQWLMQKGTKLNDVFGEKTQTKSKFIVLPVKGGWENLAGQGKDKSSKKLLKFWISSALVAYGVSNAWDLGYAMNDGDNMMMVYKK